MILKLKFSLADGREIVILAEPYLKQKLISAIKNTPLNCSLETTSIKAAVTTFKKPKSTNNEISKNILEQKGGLRVSLADVSLNSHDCRLILEALNKKFGSVGENVVGSPEDWKKFVEQNDVLSLHSCLQDVLQRELRREEDKERSDDGLSVRPVQKFTTIVEPTFQTATTTATTTTTESFQDHQGRGVSELTQDLKIIRVQSLASLCNAATASTSSSSSSSRANVDVNLLDHSPNTVKFSAPSMRKAFTTAFKLKEEERRAKETSPRDVQECYETPAFFDEDWPIPDDSLPLPALLPFYAADEGTERNKGKWKSKKQSPWWKRSFSSTGEEKDQEEEKEKLDGTKSKIRKLREMKEEIESFSSDFHLGEKEVAEFDREVKDVVRMMKVETHVFEERGEEIKEEESTLVKEEVKRESSKEEDAFVLDRFSEDSPWIIGEEEYVDSNVEVNRKKKKQDYEERERERERKIDVEEISEIDVINIL